jgi:cell wall-associated NlpC family hydrolase
MQITIDTGQLDALGNLHQQAEDELSGIVSDLRRRLLNTDFSALTGYGLTADPYVAEIEQACGRLADDVFRLTGLVSILRQELWLAAGEQPGGVGPYSAALPDASWFKLQAASQPASSTTLAASSLPPVSPGGSAVPAPIPGDISANIVATAEQWVGVPYLWGGGHGGVVAPRQENVDCSGLVHEVFGENGLSIGGTAADMYSMGTSVPDLADALPGDLLFWGTSSDIHHVAIYIGNGQMIEAPHTGAWVHVTNVYGGDFYGIRRVLPDLVSA